LFQDLDKQATKSKKMGCTTSRPHVEVPENGPHGEHKEKLVLKNLDIREDSVHSHLTEGSNIQRGKLSLPFSSHVIAANGLE
jgi:hypothetical protein